MTDADDSRLLAVLTASNLGTLATIKRDGRPQMSDVTYHADEERRTIRISITDSRAKTRNIRRDPRVSLHVTNPAGWGYAVAEGNASLTDVAERPDDGTVEALVSLYRDIRGEHPDWQEYRAAMVEQGRLVLTIEVERVYGAV